MRWRRLPREAEVGTDFGFSKPFTVTIQ